MTGKIAIILGTRPEIIKLAPVILLFEKYGVDYFLVHTGQHYSGNMSDIFFKELSLPSPKYNLVVGSGTHAKQTGTALIEIEKVLLEEKPWLVMVQGDTNSTMAGALTASKLHIRVAHVEAGLRSYDKTMPEEINRIIADHVSDYLFAPTDISKQNLQKEGIDKNKIAVVGNTIADVVEVYRNKMAGDILQKLEVTPKGFILMTLHRQENTDSRERLQKLLNGLRFVFEDHDLPIIWPIHPRTRKVLKEYGMKVPNGIKLIDPIGLFDFLDLEKNAKLVLTDSGGIQEETCILAVPCVTLRENTERPETVDAGSNVLSGFDPENIREKSSEMLKRDPSWAHPFGKDVAEKILEHLTKHMA